MTSTQGDSVVLFKVTSSIGRKVFVEAGSVKDAHTLAIKHFPIQDPGPSQAEPFEVVCMENSLEDVNWEKA